MQIHLLPYLFYDHIGPYVVHDARLSRENQRVTFKQGDLDGACGPYALMTALMISGVIERRSDAISLWTDSLLDQRTNWHKELLNGGKASSRLFGGTYEHDLPRFLDAAQRIVKPKVTVKGLPLADKNSQNGTADNKNEKLMESVISHLNKHNLPVILGLEWAGGCGHWVTVVGYQTFDSVGSKNTQTDLDNTDSLLVLDPGAETPKLCAWNGMLECIRRSRSKYPFSYFSAESVECRVADSMAIFR